MAPGGLLIFDGDDTLWVLEPLYDEARRAAREVVEAAGFPPEAWEDLQRETDVQNVRTHGFSSLRFPLSCVQAYERLALSLNREVHKEVGEAIREAAFTVFSAAAPLVPDAAETLKALSSHYDLALLTRGERWVQHHRIERSGLGGYFNLTRIVPSKTPDTFASVIDELGYHSRGTWSIGNSLRSDIYPALAVGTRGVWIDAYVWEYEQATNAASVPPGVVTLHSLRELTSLLIPRPADAL